MKFLITILFSFFLLHSFASIHPTPPEKKLFTGTLIGYVKENIASYQASGGVGLTNCVTAVYSTTRSPGELAIDDILYTDLACTVPLVGNDHGWGFVNTSGLTSIRGAKIENTTGKVLDVAFDASYTGHPGNVMTSFYHNNSGVASCGGTGFTNDIYSPNDEPLKLFNKKRLYRLPGGAYLLDGSYSVSYANGGAATYTFTVTGGNGLVTSLAYCSTNPIVNAGADQTVSMPSPTINLSGDGFDPDGSISSFAWTRTSGPNTPTITTPTLKTTGITGVIAGTYIFRLTATDNSSATGYDEVQVTVTGPPTCGTVSKIGILPRMCFGLSGQMTTGVMGIPGRRFGHAGVYFDGAADPMNGDFTADVTTGLVTRPIHNFFRYGKGNQMAVLVKLDSAINLDRFYYYFNNSDGRKTGPGVDVFFGNQAHMKAALFQFRDGNITPDFTLNCKTTSGWDSVKFIQLSGQYMLLLYNVYEFFDVSGNSQGKVNADFSSFLLYGCPKTPVSKDISIGPFWNMTLIKDTLRKSQDLAGINEATPTPQSVPWWITNMGQYYHKRGYVGLNVPATLGGVYDKYPGAWIGEVNTPNAIDLSSYAGYAGGSYFLYDYDLVQSGRTILESNRAINARLYNQTHLTEVVPVDSLGADTRLGNSWNRFAYNEKSLALKFGPDNNPNNYQYARFVNDPWPGIIGMNIMKEIEVGNEWNAGYRAPGDSNYLDPMSMGAMMKTVYNAIKFVSPNIKVVIGGYAAWDMEGYWAMEMILQIDNGAPTKVYDISEMHTTITNIELYVDGGNEGKVGMNGALPGLRGERKKYIGFIDTLAMLSGFNRESHCGEYSYTENRNGPQSNQGPEVYVSTLGAPGYPQHEYALDVNQAIAYNQVDEHYSFVPGLTRKYQYEAVDASYTSSPFRRNADNSNGVLLIDLTPKAGWYYDMSKKERLYDWKGSRVIADSLRGQWLAERVKVGRTDSFCLSSMWQDTLDAVSARVITLPLDVISVRHYRFQYNSLVPFVEDIPTPLHLLVWTPDQRGDLFFYQSTLGIFFPQPDKRQFPYRIKPPNGGP